MEIGDGIFRQVARKFRLDADPRRIRLYRQRQYPFDGPSSRLLQAYYDIGRHEPGRRRYLVYRYVEERISVVIQHWQIVERQAYGLAGLLVVQAELLAGKRLAQPHRDRKSGGQGKGWAVRGDAGGRRVIEETRKRIHRY